jgi:hypothetical protein
VMVCCQPIGSRVSGIHFIVLCVRGEKILKIERKIFIEKERGNCIGWMSRHVDVVCAKVQVHVYGGVATVVVEL